MMFVSRDVDVPPTGRSAGSFHDKGGMVACALLMCLAAPVEAAAPAPPWERLHKSHPRLYLNDSMLPAIRARALGAEKDHFERMKRRNGVRS